MHKNIYNCSEPVWCPKCKFQNWYVHQKNSTTFHMECICTPKVLLNVNDHLKECSFHCHIKTYCEIVLGGYLGIGQLRLNLSLKLKTLGDEYYRRSVLMHWKWKLNMTRTFVVWDVFAEFIQIFQIPLRSQRSHTEGHDIQILCKLSRVFQIHRNKIFNQPISKNSQCQYLIKSSQ